MKEIIGKTRGREIPHLPEVPIPEITNMGMVGQIIHQVRALDDKEASKTRKFDKESREKFKRNEEKWIGSMHQLFQNTDPPKVDESFLGSRNEYLSDFLLDYEREEGANKDLRWCSVIVEIVYDGTWINPGNRRHCYKI